MTLRICLLTLALAMPAARAAIDEDVHHLLIEEQFDAADAAAKTALDAATGQDPAAMRSRLTALNLLIDSAEIQHKFAAPATKEWIEEALQLSRHLFGDRSRATAKLVSAMAYHELELAATDKQLSAHARKLLDQSLQLESSESGNLSPADVAFVYRTAVDFDYSGNQQDALKWIEHAELALKEPRTDWERRWHAQQLGVLGSLQMSGKRPADGLASARAGVALAERVSGNNSIFAAGTHFALAQAMFFTGDYEGARAAMEPAIPVFRNHPDAPPIYFDVSLSILGDSYLELGDYPKARAYFEELIARLEPRKAENSSTFQMYITELNNFAWLERAEGHPDAARAWFKKEIQAIEQSGNSNIEREAVAVIGLGDLEVQHGNLDAAEEYYRRAAEVATASHNDSRSPWIGLGRANIALARADPAHAQELLSGAIAALKASLGDQQYGMLTLRCTQALAQARLGRYDEAYDEAAASEKFRIALMHDIAPALSETQMLNVKHHMEESGRCTGILLAAAAHAQDPKRLPSLWEQIANGRNLSTRLQTVRLAAGRRAADAQSRNLWLAWQNAATSYAASLFERETPPTELIDKRAALDKAEASLGKEAIASIHWEGNASSFGDMLAQRPADSVLVAFAEVASFDVSPQASGFEASGRSLYALISEGQSVRLVALGDSAAVEAKIARWLTLLRQPETDVGALAKAGRAVRTAIWDPLAIEHAATRVLIVPDGAVFRVNFAALPDGEGFLVERGWRVHMLESEQDLQVAPVRNVPQTLLAVGSPDFGPTNDLAGASSRDTCAPRFTPLPGTGAEVDRLADLWRKKAHGEPELLKGSAASKSTLSAKIAKASVIHIATHSFELGHECSAASTRGVGLAVQARDARETPIESGLALAGANGFFAGGDTSGILTSEDVVTMSLDRAQWVVLAACDTGLGTVVNGEGVFGLRHAFHLAGARTVVMSLWKVDDVATSEWMDWLYRTRLQGEDTAQSVARAELSTIAARRARGESIHPFYWAAFVASGDWR